jgi:multimeric flavodoxin WrbA
MRKRRIFMKITVFQGSPRKDGNTDLLLGEAMKRVAGEDHQVTSFVLNEMSIRPCQNCGGCEHTGLCVISDDMGEVYSAIREADRIVLASPIFFFGLSAQTKAMIDRCQAFWCEKYLLKKEIPAGPFGRKGLLLLVGGMKNQTGTQCSGSTATAFFRTISVPEHETLSYLNIDEKGAISHHPTALTDVAQAAERLVAT